MTRRARWTAPLAALALLLGTLALSAGPAAATSTDITQGSVTWGVKQSWRNYIGESGISVANGVTRATNGAFNWPVVSGAYESDTKRLELQLRGSVHFTAHEGALDMTVSNPRVVIDGDDPQVFADVVSKSESSGQMTSYGEIPLVSLDLSTSAPDTVSGVTSWTPIATTLSAQGFDAFSRNYPTGTVMDPVSVSYTGPGAKPVALLETWTPAGSLAYEQKASYPISQVTAVLPDTARGIVHVATATSLQAYDLTTFQPVGTPLAVGHDAFPNAVLDLDAGAVVMNVANKMTAYRWNPATTSYDATVLLASAVQGYSYDRFGHRVVAADPSTGVRTFTFANGAWTAKTFALSAIPSSRPQITADTKGRIVIVAAGYVPALVTITGDNATVAALPGDYTNADAAQEQFQYPSEVFAPSTGGFVLTNYTGKIYRVREASGTYTRDAVVRRTGLGAVLRATPDYSTDTWYLADNTLQTVTAVTEDTTGSFKVKDLGYYVLYPIGLGAADGTVYVAASQLFGSNEAYGIRTFRGLGTSPSFTTQPSSATATLGVGATSDTVTFTAAATGAPVATLQWQQRAAATGRFANVDGATGTTLQVSAGAAANGRQYRAIASNAAGSLASEVATLTVNSAPSTVIDLSDQTVQDGATATFEVMPAGNPYPTITWQRRVGGYWQTIGGDDDNFVVAGGKLTAPATNLEQSGTLLRAKLANPVAAIYSRTATLTVEEPSTAERVIDAGQLDWGVKKSFRDYVTGPIAHGTVTVSGGATRNPDGTFAFAVDQGSYDPAARKTTVDFDGTVRFSGHDGALELTLGDPAVSITGSSGTLTAKVTSKSLESGQSVDYGRVEVATLDTTSGVTVGGGKVALAGVPATLTAAGAPAFAGFYPAGAALDVLGASLDLGAEVGVDAASTTTVKAASASFGYGTTTKVTVKVASSGGTPTGTTTVTVGGRRLTGTLANGSATVALPAGLTPGTYPVTATFAGSAGIAASTGTVDVRVTKASPKVATTLGRSTIKRTQRVRLKIVAKIPGGAAGTPAVGQVVVRDGGRVIAIGILKPSAKGTVVVKLPRLRKGKHYLRVTLQGNSNQATASSGYRVLRVR